MATGPFRHCYSFFSGASDRWRLRLRLLLQFRAHCSHASPKPPQSGCLNRETESQQTKIWRNAVTRPEEDGSDYRKHIWQEPTDLHKNEKREEPIELHKKELVRLYDKVLVVDNVETAKAVVRKLITEYRDFVHACDTEVMNIDVRQDTPVDHGEITCFSIYCGENADFGDEKCGLWVDVLDGGMDVLMEFKPFFEDPSIKKVWHNYSFDSHIIENYGIKLSGFHADTMHLARLWDSSRRRINGGYSLEALTSDPKVMSQDLPKDGVFSIEKISSAGGISAGFMYRKVSLKSIFGKKRLKKDGSNGKLITLAPVEMLQRGEERIPWICYSVLDAISTLMLFESLKEKLKKVPWHFLEKGSMYDFYKLYWRPFGALLIKMESQGMLVDQDHLSKIKNVAIIEHKLAAERFREWASKKCPDAKYMNVESDLQLRQLFFGGTANRKDPNDVLPISKTFKVPNIENVLEEGKKTPKYHTITLTRFKDMEDLETDLYTPSGWPSLSGGALKTFAGKIPTAETFLMDSESDLESPSSIRTSDEKYGTAFKAFRGKNEGRYACHAIEALREVCSISSLVSNFILPLQGGHMSGIDGRIHCSLNINSETGRMSASRPNIQNQLSPEKDRYKIRQAFIAKPGNSLVVADYRQLKLRILAHLANCRNMLDAFKAGGDFHSRTTMDMYDHVNKAVVDGKVLLEWNPQPGEDEPPVPLLKDVFTAERRKAKMLNFSIAHGQTHGFDRDWKVDLKESKKMVELWYKDRPEVLSWQEQQRFEAQVMQCVTTLLGRICRFPLVAYDNNARKDHIDKAATNNSVQGSVADVLMCAMLEIDKSVILKELGWELLLQVRDEVILEGPKEWSETAKAIVTECMSKPFDGKNILSVNLSVQAKCAQNWYAATY